jgi:DNA polymerase-3 subunit epsilon
MRSIILDTETTGMDPFAGDRIVEIGCIELHNHVPTGRSYQQYINPERAMSAAAQAVHGLSDEFLKKHPTFGEIVGAFLEFIGDAPLIIHNADFDMKFVNHHLAEFGFAPIPSPRVIDSLKVARQKFPGAPASLDALCKRFNIDNSNRTLHGALLDAELLAEVYLELIGGRQTGLDLLQPNMGSGAQAAGLRTPRPARPHPPLADEESAAHRKMVVGLKNPLWPVEGDI